MTPSQFLQSKTASKIILILGIFIVAVAIFTAGMFFGSRKAAFMSHRADTFRRGMDDPRSPFMPFMRGGDQVNSHGTIGEIVSINLPTMLVKGPNSAEQLVTIATSTAIRTMNSTAGTADLTVGTHVIVIGAPDDSGHIQASFIRILPPPNTFMPASSSMMMRTR